MAIFGVGSNWEDGEHKEDFFKEHKFILGWNEKNAKDLYALIASLKVGDILYIKSNQPGSRTIKVKGVGIVKKNFISCIIDNGKSNTSDWRGLFVEVEWLHKDEFEINIPDGEGKLTCFRSATSYEEYLPFVQSEIIKKIIDK